MANGRTPMSFKDFTTIVIKRRRLSSATVSKRLEELVAADAIREVITRSKSGRRIIAYKTTEKGRKLMELAREFNKALTASKTQFLV